MKFFPVFHFTVSGSSMLPTLKSGQDILCFNWAYLFYGPKVGDIVVIRKNGKDMVKRIQKVHDREYFVEGDNNEGSTDSRSFGTVSRTEIIGKVILVVR